MGTSKHVVERVGPFDEDPSVRLAEDCDWSYRALRAGVPIVYAPQVAVLHYGWRGEAERSDQYRAYARSQIPPPSFETEQVSPELIRRASARAMTDDIDPPSEGESTLVPEVRARARTVLAEVETDHGLSAIDDDSQDTPPEVDAADFEESTNFS